MINIRSWYYRKGGLYLSDETRVRYFNLMKELEKVVKDDKMNLDTALKTIKEEGHNLREYLSKDVGTRKKPQLE